MVGAQQFADRWGGRTIADGKPLRLPARMHFISYMFAVGTADIADDSFEFWIVGHRLRFRSTNRFFTPRLDDAPLMGSNRTECTTAEAATHDGDRILYRFEKAGNRFFVAWVRLVACTSDP